MIYGIIWVVLFEIVIMMQYSFNPNEVVILAANSNCFEPGLKRKGKLILTNQRLCFKSFNWEHNNFELAFGNKEIKEIEYFNTFGLIPNGLKVYFKNGISASFSVSKRNRWSKQLVNCI